MTSLRRNDGATVHAMPTGAARLARVEPQQVIIREPGLEIHAYAIEADGAWVTIVWRVASGRCRRRRVSSARVFLPSGERPWRGLPIRPEELRTLRGAAG